MADDWPEMAEVLDVFVLADDGSLAPLHPSGDDDPLDVRGLSADVIEALREVRARPGYRLGAAAPVTDKAARRGDREEILQPVLVRPAAAHRVVGDGRLFDAPIPALEIDIGSARRDGDSYTWKASLRSSRLARGRSAALHLHPSPSANLSVLELIPAHRRRFARKRFVRRGVAAVDAIGRRLSQQARQPAPAGQAGQAGRAGPAAGGETGRAAGGETVTASA